jgi:hypothetical protein
MMMLNQALPGTNGDKEKLRDNLENIQGTGRYFREL